MVDKVGRRDGFTLTPGNAHEPHSLPAKELIADGAHDTNAAPAPLAKRDIATVISSRANRKVPRRYAPGVYGMRHFVANRFAAIPQGVSGNCNTARQVGIAIRRDA